MRDFLTKKIQRTKPATVEFTTTEGEKLLFNVAEVSGQEIGAAVDRLEWEKCIARAEDGSVRWLQTNDADERAPEAISQASQVSDVASLVKIVVAAQREILEPLGKAYKEALDALKDALKTQSAAYSDLLNLALNRIAEQSETEADAIEAIKNQQDNENQKPDMMQQVLEVAGPALAALATQQAPQVPQAPPPAHQGEPQAPQAPRRQRLGMPPVQPKG